MTHGTAETLREAASFDRLMARRCEECGHRFGRHGGRCLDCGSCTQTARTLWLGKRKEVARARRSVTTRRQRRHHDPAEDLPFPWLAPALVESPQAEEER